MFESIKSIFGFVKGIVAFIRMREVIPRVKDGTRYIAMITRPRGGGQYMHIEGAKYPLRAAPRDFVLHGPLRPFKHFIDKVIRRYLGETPIESSWIRRSYLVQLNSMKRVNKN